VPSDHPQADVAELMLDKYADDLAGLPASRSMYEAQAGVGRAREGDLGAARRHFAAAVRTTPSDAHSWARLATAIVPPLARRRWPPYPEAP
jgi:hypothetical protein